LGGSRCRLRSSATRPAVGAGENRNVFGLVENARRVDQQAMKHAAKLRQKQLKADTAKIERDASATESTS
jgi:hypothetical protein